MNAATLRTKGLTKVYRTGTVEVTALRGVDFEAREGEFIVMLGPSGSGKSTFLNIVGGLDQATSGEAWFQEHNLTAMDERGLTLYRRDHVGFVFQFYNLVPSLTARENVSLVTEIARNPMKPEEALSLVGLEQRMDHFPAQLSGGEQQRVAIARAVINRPDLLVADEPTGNVDAEMAQRLMHLFGALNRLGTTVVVATHDIGLISATPGARLIRLESGTLVDPTGTLRNPPRPVRGQS